MSCHNLVSDLLCAACGACLSSCIAVTLLPAILLRCFSGNSLLLDRVPQRGMELTLKTEVQRKRTLNMLWFYWLPACLFWFSFTAYQTSFVSCNLYPHLRKCSLSPFTSASPPTRPSTDLASRDLPDQSRPYTALFSLTL